MAADLTGSLAAFSVAGLFFLVPGYAAAWWFNLLEFRRRTALFRIAFSIPLSLGLFPVISYLAARFVSMHAVWALYGICWIGFAAVMARRREWRSVKSRPGLPPTIIVAVAVWMG